MGQKTIHGVLTPWDFWVEQNISHAFIGQYLVAQIYLAAMFSLSQQLSLLPMLE